MADARLLDDCVTGILVSAVSAANTAAATSGAGQWFDVSNWVGDLLIVQNLGALTGAGSVNGKMQAASDVNGTGAADITGATFTSVTTSPGGAQVLAVDPATLPSNKTFIGYVGTITGFTAVLIAVTVVARKRNT